ncbi:MAG: hypothetical protein GX442_04960 [Candidatus Riflebacteria bacterium]|nr:hypothetical protein [Candidatus Riflebacteria bacterium]
MTMSPREIHHEWQEAGLVTLSRPVLLGVAGSLVVMTGMLMLLFSQLDLDTWLDRHDLAVKVGGSSITLEEFRQLKEAAPPAARALSNQQFAAEVVETLLLAEAGRHLRLDRHEEYLRLREAFDQAAGQPGGGATDLPAGWATGSPAGTASPGADLVRAWFLIEELARLTRARIAESAPDLGGLPPGFRGHDTEPPSGTDAFPPTAAGRREPGPAPAPTGPDGIPGQATELPSGPLSPPRIAAGMLPPGSAPAGLRSGSVADPGENGGHDSELPSGNVALPPVPEGRPEPVVPPAGPGGVADTMTGHEPTATSPETAPPARLHLQKLVVADETAARQVLELAAAGTPFPTLNASFSRSLYVAVGGDLGWKRADDLPPGVFETLAAGPVGSLTRAYADAEGVHLFLVKARPNADPRLADRQAAGMARQEGRRLAERRFLQTMRSTLPIWVHPTLAGSTRPE